MYTAVGERVSSQCFLVNICSLFICKNKLNWLKIIEGIPKIILDCLKTSLKVTQVLAEIKTLDN